MQQQKPKRKLPERKCTGCGEKFKKLDLIRVVRTPQGNIEIDRTGKAAGRGAYVCRDVACFQKVRKSGRLARSLACEIPEEVYDKLMADLADAQEEGI